MAYEFDYDFIGFTFNGKHSIDDFGIYRTSDGNRYNTNLIPQLNDKTADVPGGDGQYFFYSTYKTRQFTIPIAFDNLSEETLNEVRMWLKGKEIAELVFDETPYKVYSAKVTGTPQLKVICFEFEGQRVYKGEGSIQFTCYYPYAHTPSKTKSGGDGRALDSYTEDFYPTKQEWAAASGISNVFIEGSNPGNIPASFRFGYNIKNWMFKKGDVLRVGDLTIVIQEDCKELIWDSKTGLIQGKINNITRAIKFIGKSYGTIPVNGVFADEIYLQTLNSQNQKVYYYTDGRMQIESLPPTSTTAPVILEYHYWYL